MRITFANATHRWGGVKSWTLAVARGLAGRGHEVDVILRPGDAFGEALGPRAVAGPAAAGSSAGVPVHRVHFGPDWNPFAVAWFKRHLAGRDVLVTNVGKDNRTAGLGARLAGVPVAHRVGGPGDLTGRAAVRWAHRHIVSAILVPSESTRKALLAHPWIGEGDVTVIPNGVDLDVFRPGAGRGKLRALVGAGPSDLVMVTTGQLTALKGHRFLLRALARIGPDNGPWRLAIIGKGPEEEPLKSLALELGIADRVHFPGFRRDVHELLEDADLALQPSTMEGLPHSVVEFMAKGKAVVASRLDGIMEAVEEGVTGILVPPESPEELARAIGELHARPETRWDMGRAARRRAEARFGLDIMLDRVEAFFDGVSRASRAAGRR